MRIIYVCEDSLTGIFSGIYEVWKRKMTAEEAGLEVGDSFERRLFCEYIFCKAERKALAVIRMIQKNLGADVYEKISYALLSADRRKAEMVFRAMLEAKKLSRKDRLMEHLGNEAVRAVFGMYRQVANEAHHYKGFVRRHCLQKLSQSMQYFRVLQNTLQIAFHRKTGSFMTRPMKCF